MASSDIYSSCLLMRSFFFLSASLSIMILISSTLICFRFLSSSSLRNLRLFLSLVISVFFYSIWSAITERTLSFSDSANSDCNICSVIYACLFSYLSTFALSSFSMFSFWTISSADRCLNVSNYLASFLKLSLDSCSSLSFLLYVSSFFYVS